MAETRRPIRDWDRADAWLSLASLALVVVISLVGSSIGRELAPIQAISLLAFLAHPYFLIRVIRHFRPVPEWWTRGLLAAAIVGTAVAAALPSPRPITFRVVAILFVGSTIMGASVTLAATARRYRGLAAWRLNFAAVEAALVLVVLLLLVVAATDDGYVFVLDHLGSNRNLSFALAACYYFGLLPPRRLRRALLRSVEYQFLRRTSEHPPNDRGRLITIDLAHAVAHGVPNAGTLVLIGNGTLHVAASSVPGARGINLHEFDGGHADDDDHDRRDAEHDRRIHHRAPHLAAELDLLLDVGRQALEDHIQNAAGLPRRDHVRVERIERRAAALERVHAHHERDGEHAVDRDRHRQVSARRRSAARSPIITAGACVWPRLMVGMIDTSATRNPPTPRTRSAGSTTLVVSAPMRQVPAGWYSVSACSARNRSIAASESSAGPSMSGPT